MTRAAGVEAGGEEVERDLEDVLLHAAGVGVVGGECVQVGDEEVAVVVVLQVDPVVQRTHVVAEVKAAGGSHAGEYTGARCCAGRVRRAHGFRSLRIAAAGARRGVQSVKSMVLKIVISGPKNIMMTPKPTKKKAIIIHMLRPS